MFFSGHIKIFLMHKGFSVSVGHHFSFGITAVVSVLCADMVGVPVSYHLSI